MANKMTDMSKIRKVIHLHHQSANSTQTDHLIPI